MKSLCDKIVFESRHAATHSRSARRNKGRRMRAYFCTYCHGWHLTTQHIREQQQ